MHTFTTRPSQAVVTDEASLKHVSSVHFGAESSRYAIWAALLAPSLISRVPRLLETSSHQKFVTRRSWPDLASSPIRASSQAASAFRRAPRHGPGPSPIRLI